MECTASHRCFGGTVSYYTHASSTTATDMRFSVFFPEGKNAQPWPYMLFLSGLTCSEENFTTKAGAYAHAAALGMAIIVPDTSPRGDDVADDDAYDLGQGAGFYLDATSAPWSSHFNMESYIIRELIPLIELKFPLDATRRCISGHSMGGHGALTLHLKHPGMFASCTAFAPIVAPASVPWGKKAFQTYLGGDVSHWQQHDACALMQEQSDRQQAAPILIDQGSDDPFLDEQLKPHLFADACQSVKQPLTLRMQPGYDHSYFFIQSFIADHLNWHIKNLQG